MFKFLTINLENIYTPHELNNHNVSITLVTQCVYNGEREKK